MNIRNFRDISGYRNRNGKVMKKNMIFRGGALNHMTKEQADYFENVLGIRHILDFRDEREAEMAKDYPFSAAAYERIGALRVRKHEDAGFNFEKIAKDKMDAGQFQYILKYLKEGYKTMAFDNPAYQRLFALLLENNGNLYSREQRAKWLLADIWRLPRGSNIPLLCSAASLIPRCLQRGL